MQEFYILVFHSSCNVSPRRLACTLHKLCKYEFFSFLFSRFIEATNRHIIWIEFFHTFLSPRLPFSRLRLIWFSNFKWSTWHSLCIDGDFKLLSSWRENLSEFSTLRILRDMFFVFLSLNRFHLTQNRNCYKLENL